MKYKTISEWKREVEKTIDEINNTPMGESKYPFYTMKMLGKQLEMLNEIEDMIKDKLQAINFHNKYEKYAPSYDYITRTDTLKFDNNSNNGKLMKKTCDEILKEIIGE